ncbi:chondroitin AC/alginate lyase [Cristinia sonorae]|uniref:Chondroitin AC/alginate lyase n=1 Tax=Cristinia sonorae TaxID=1940300 RepID=A0A8K0UPR5_9AGAR|nr:chondroitin AC/alginate lyase [Cristinia sonorae]
MAPPQSFKTTLFLVGTALCLSPAQALTNYANIFFNPDVLAAGSFDQATLRAQKTVISWAQELAGQGPWNVTSKGIPPPSGNKHDYMSFSPYSWPDCSNAGNTTELTPEQIWTTCEYVTRDGQFNPDARAVNDIGNFDDMANAVFYNALAWVIDGSSTYSANTAKYIQAWFVDADTAMNPNLNFAQMKRGPDGQEGSHSGVLDLKCLSKIVNGILILRDRKAPEWTSDLDNTFTAWAKTYTQWLQTAPTAVEESQSTNNHGTFYYNQLAALQLLVGDKDSAVKTVQTYFSSLYLNQINANGDQPLESNRTRPYHYRAYNIAAMITLARIGEYAGYKAWDTKTSAGATIQTAVDFAMLQQPGDDTADELYPYVAAAGVQYGDPDGKYAKFLSSSLGNEILKDPFYMWDTLAIPGLATPTSHASTTHKGTGAGGAHQTGGAGYKPPANAAFSEFAFSNAWSVVIAAVACALYVV